MQFLGIDIAKHTHVAGVRAEDGTPHGKAFEFVNDQAGFKSPSPACASSAAQQTARS